MPYKDRERQREYDKQRKIREKGKTKEQLKEEKRVYDADYKQRRKKEISLYQKDYARRKKYGITYDTYLEMYNKQHGLCAICGQKETRKGYDLHVDHNHITGKIRGLLCNRCNVSLGLFGDSDIILKRAYEYLRKEYKMEDEDAV